MGEMGDMGKIGDIDEMNEMDCMRKKGPHCTIKSWAISGDTTLSRWYLGWPVTNARIHVAGVTSSPRARFTMNCRYSSMRLNVVVSHRT